MSRAASVGRRASPSEIPHLGLRVRGRNAPAAVAAWWPSSWRIRPRLTAGRTSRVFAEVQVRRACLSQITILRDGRNKLIVKLPREARIEPAPPSAEHVEAVYRLLPPRHRLAAALARLVGRPRREHRRDARRATTTSRRRRVRLRAADDEDAAERIWVDLPDVLADAHRGEDRSARGPRRRGAASSPPSGGDALRTSIAKACKAAGVPLWSPHDLRHRRISLLHLRGMPWARIGEFVGHRDLSVTADTYTHAMADETELDYSELLG